MNVNSVYELNPDLENCSSLVFCGDHPALELIDVIDGMKNVTDLPPLEAERSPCGFHVSEPNQLPLCDIAHLFSGFLTLSSRTQDLLSNLLDGFGTWIPLEVRGGKDESFKMFHTTFRVNALDDSRSEVKRFRTGRIYRFIRPVFRPEKLEGVPIFRQEGSRDTFVTNIFRDAVESAHLTGFEFLPVWKA